MVNFPTEAIPASASLGKATTNKELIVLLTREVQLITFIFDFKMRVYAV
jgi:hypothetical protein